MTARQVTELRRLAGAAGGVPKQTARVLLRSGYVRDLGNGRYEITRSGRTALRGVEYREYEDRVLKVVWASRGMAQRLRDAVEWMKVHKQLVDFAQQNYAHHVAAARVAGMEPAASVNGSPDWDAEIARRVDDALTLIGEFNEAMEEAERTGGTVRVSYEVERPAPVRAARKERIRAATSDGVTDLTKLRPLR